MAEWVAWRPGEVVAAAAASSVSGVQGVVGAAPASRWSAVAATRGGEPHLGRWPGIA